MSSSFVQVTVMPAFTASSAGENWNCLTVTAPLPAALPAVPLDIVVGAVDAAVSGRGVSESDPPHPASRTAATAPAPTTGPRRRLHRIGSYVIPDFRTGACPWMKKCSCGGQETTLPPYHLGPTTTLSSPIMMMARSVSTNLGTSSITAAHSGVARDSAMLSSSSQPRTATPS